MHSCRKCSVSLKIQAIYAFLIFDNIDIIFFCVTIFRKIFKYFACCSYKRSQTWIYIFRMLFMAIKYFIYEMNLYIKHKNKADKNISTNVNIIFVNLSCLSLKLVCYEWKCLLDYQQKTLYSKIAYISSVRR